MGRIHVLDEQIANQIAAGEVVERPSSVVKELVENAIDAGATRIDVTIEEGGLQLMRVRDNGAGMDELDCKLAFSRHATSKIATGKDLFHIRTLGFRGEALPSIASVAKVTCVTSPDGSGLGHRIAIEGGSGPVVDETASPQGTDITVRDLFYNTPARLKYMKTVQTEMSHISDYMYRLALAYPEIAFTLRHNGNSLLHTTGRGGLLQVIAAVYGGATAKQMIQLDTENPDYTLSGYISKPELNRSNRQAVTLIVNGRYVRSFALVNAILKAYHTLLPIHRFPLAVIHLQMTPSLLDVNVHPAKLEVRFSKEAELCQFVETSIRHALGRQTLIPEQRKAVVKEHVVQESMPLYPQPTDEDDPHNGAAARTGAPEQAGAGGASVREYRALTDAAARESASALEQTEQRARQPRLDAPRSGHTAEYAPQAGYAQAAKPPQSQPQPQERASASARARQPGSWPRQTTADAALGLFQPPAAHADKPVFPELFPVGQAHGTYIIAQNENGLYLIDQHAAHERIHYEQFYELFGSPADASQELIVPLTLEFTPADAELLKQRLPLFEQIGVHLEFFGGQTFLVRACPHWLPKGEEQQVIEEIAAWILEDKQADIGKLREQAAIMCSCKASIKANDALTLAEIEALLLRLSRCRSPFTCPHGRPIIVSFSKYELEKMFKRVM